MKILDKYILKKFLSTFIFILLLVIIVFICINYAEQNEDFVDHNLPFKTICYYYLSSIPFIINLTLPIIVFIATTFFTAKLAQQTEIIAMMSTQISLLRLSMIYLVGSICIALCSFVLTGWIMCYANEYKIDFEIKYLRNSDPYAKKLQNIHRKIDHNLYFYVETYNHHEHIGKRFTIEYIKENQMLEKTTADIVKWLPKENKWRLENWIKRKIDPHTHQETIERGSLLDQSLNIIPDDLQVKPFLYQRLTLPALNQYIKNLKIKHADNVKVFLVEKYVRYMSPFSVILLVFMAFIVSSYKRRGGMGLQFGIGFALAFIYIAFFTLCKLTAEKNAHYLLLSVWMPNIIFSFISVGLYYVNERY